MVSQCAVGGISVEQHNIHRFAVVHQCLGAMAESRNCGLSAHFQQEAAEFTLCEYCRARDVCCRGVAGDFPVRFDVAAAGCVHHGTDELHMACDERRKLIEWNNGDLQGCTARLVPLAYEIQEWEERAIEQRARLARLEVPVDGGIAA